VTAAAVYISAIICGEHRSQKQVAEATDISEVTLRSRYRELADGLGIRIEFS
jgi:transcription initiation factor TFIIB